MRASINLNLDPGKGMMVSVFCATFHDLTI